MPATYTVAEYVQALRAIHNTGSATAETSFYPPLDRLFNAIGETLKPKVLFFTQLRTQGAGLPDGGFFPQHNTRNTGARPLTNPERGAVEIKPAGYSLDTLTHSDQTRRYLQQYGLVLLTNLHEFRLVGLSPTGAPRDLEKYVLARTPDDLWYRTIDPSTTSCSPTSSSASCSTRSPSPSPRT